MILAELGSAYWRRLTRCVRHMMEGTRMEMRVSWNTLEHQLCELSAYYRILNNNNCLEQSMGKTTSVANVKMSTIRTIYLLSKISTIQTTYVSIIWSKLFITQNLNYPNYRSILQIFHYPTAYITQTRKYVFCNWNFVQEHLLISSFRVFLLEWFQR